MNLQPKREVWLEARIAGIPYEQKVRQILMSDPILVSIMEERMNIEKIAVPRATFTNSGKFVSINYDPEIEKQIVELFARYEARSRYIINFYQD